jgi:hypothetical protein
VGSQQQEAHMNTENLWNPLNDAPDRWTFVEVCYADGSTGRARWSGVWQIAPDHNATGWRYFAEDAQELYSAK